MLPTSYTCTYDFSFLAFFLALSGLGKIRSKLVKYSAGLYVKPFNKIYVCKATIDTGNTQDTKHCIGLTSNTRAIRASIGHSK